ncbi:hypothetical protein L2E82_00880 [Cichorium intybus]|uniref:Uncharacterized protein n=1 Tax=Cichorium intybus TaxID=13427 RepID=A0ACB9GX75_CICIN|nr:hypothetical protein L2E82_00880 [Cichorium intybus]
MNELFYSELWVGPAYSNSPPPSSLSIPNFSVKQKRTVSLDLPSVSASGVDLLTLISKFEPTGDPCVSASVTSVSSKKMKCCDPPGSSGVPDSGCRLAEDERLMILKARIEFEKQRPCIRFQHHSVGFRNSDCNWVLAEVESDDDAGHTGDGSELQVAKMAGEGLGDDEHGVGG